MGRTVHSTAQGGLEHLERRLLLSGAVELVGFDGDAAGAQSLVEMTADGDEHGGGSLSGAGVSLAAIEMNAAVNIGPFTAELSGQVTDLGSEAPVVTVFYGTADGDETPLAWQHSVDLGEIFGGFAVPLDALSASTTYFFRARASNSAGEAWSSPTRQFQTPAAPLVEISEFMAANSATLTTRIRPAAQDPFGPTLTPDWVELKNLTDQPVDVSGYHLTDDASAPTKWTFPAGAVIPAGGHLVVFASDENITDPALDERGYLHLSFKLSADGEALALIDPAGEVIHGYLPQYPPQFNDVSYGLSDGGAAVYFATATPGADNAGGQINFVADTAFSIDRGFFDAPFDVAITVATPGATIRYTTDGSAPGETEGTLYTGPITIDRTTTLRAIAFKPGFVASNIDTQSYLFIDDVVQQTFASTLDAGFPTSWNGWPTDYGLDPDVIGPNDLFGGIYAAAIHDSLLAIPTLSLVGDIDGLFGPEGIYSNPRDHDREITASAELLLPDGGQGFQLNAGLKIQGGAFRLFQLAKKKSLRLKFTAQHGPTKLDYPLFGDDAADSFDTITLRMEANDGWQWSAAGGQPQYARDEFGRRSQLAMGQPSSHGTNMHVYINGVYWGVYNPVERPDASFAATYFGGDKDEWDVQNSGSAVDGDLASWNAFLALAADVQNAATPALERAAYQRLLGNYSDGTNNPAWETYLDADNYIDYLIVNWYGGNNDWPFKNYYLGRRRGPESTGFKFFMWDAEWSLFLRSDLTTNRLSDVRGAATPWGMLRDNPDFRLRFADRVHKAFLEPGGAFYVDPQNPHWDPTRPERNAPAARYVDITDNLRLPLIAESARWGDQHHSVPFVVEDDWLAERDRIIDEWFPQRSAIMMDQFRAAGLYPDVDAPRFEVNGAAKHGGVIAADDLIDLAATEAVYYTLDGSDPRHPDGTISPAAMAYGGGGVALSEATRLAARALAPDGTWSAVSETDFFLNPLAAAGDLIISEIMYHPPPPTAEELAAQAALDPAFDPADADARDYEFIELLNLADHTINLAGVRFKQTGLANEGIEFTYGVSTLASGQRAVIVADLAAFEARYGGGINVAGTFDGSLSNSGERLSLFDRGNASLLTLDYDDDGAWPGRADGDGSSLEPINPQGDANDGNNWRAGSEYGGSPGREGLGPDNRVVINEVLTHTDLPQLDAIELFNTTEQAIDISGFWLSDTAADYQKFRIPDGTIIPARGYLVFDEEDFNPGGGANSNDFALDGAAGEDVWLLAADAAGRLTRFVDHAAFDAAYNGQALGRWPNADGADGPLVPLTAPSLGGHNHGPHDADVIISELMYHPAAVPAGTPANISRSDLEYVELFNTAATAVDISGWRVSGIDFTFNAGVTINAGEAIVLVPFDPQDVDDADKLAIFESVYGVTAATARLIGPFAGRLDNGGERIRLRSPDESPPDDPLFIPLVQQDEIDYDDAAPWPVEADGQGQSLHRALANGFGRFAANWRAEAPSPGTAAPPFDLTAPAVSVHDVNLGAGQRSIVTTFAVTFDEPVDLPYDAVTLLNVSDGSTIPLAATAFSIDAGSHTALWSFPHLVGATLPDGNYEAVVRATAVRDAADNPLDGDDNGQPGDHHLVSFFRFFGDRDGDRDVDFADLFHFRKAFQTDDDDADYDRPFDDDGDGDVDFADLFRFRGNFQRQLDPISGRSAPLVTEAPLTSEASEVKTFNSLSAGEPTPEPVGDRGAASPAASLRRPAIHSALASAAALEWRSPPPAATGGFSVLRSLHASFTPAPLRPAEWTVAFFAESH